EPGRDVADGGAGGLRLVEHLQRVLAPFATAAHGYSRLLNNETISMAARAASQPLFPPLAPARSIAWCRLSVVRTPKVTGRPASSATAAVPRATSAQTCSK